MGEREKPDRDPSSQAGQAMTGGLDDITLSKAQAEAIEKHRLSLRALLDNQPHLAWLKDREGHFLAVNKAFAQACGQPGPEVVAGKTDLDVWPRALAEAYRADDDAVIA